MRILGMLMGMLVALGFGCSGHDKSAQKAGSSSDEHREASGPADTSIDPVSGKDVRTDAAWKTNYAGRTYYFDSEDNMKQFAAKPSRFVHEDGRLKDSGRRIESGVK